jgi:hypothetical protein
MALASGVRYCFELSARALILAGVAGRITVFSPMEMFSADAGFP